MKRARVAYRGAIHNAVADGAGLRLANEQQVGEDEVVWLPPFVPRTVFALGLNYAAHQTELGFKPPEKPLIFLKGANAFVGHKGETPRPADATNMHYECELAVVIGKRGKNIPKEEAMAYVAGYTVANDYAIRDYLENYYRPNFRVKSRDGTTPIGPWLVDAADVSEPHNLALRTSINGALTQSGTTADMVFDIPFLIAYLSEFMTLAPGDAILTGTPEGVKNVEPGDEVITEIEGVGRLVNRIVADEGS